MSSQSEFAELFNLIFLSFICQTVQFSQVKKLECCFDSCSRQTVRNETIVHATLHQEAYIWRRKMFRWCCNREHCMTFVYINKMTVNTITSCTTNVGIEWHKKHQSQKTLTMPPDLFLFFAWHIPTPFQGLKKHQIQAHGPNFSTLKWHWRSKVRHEKSIIIDTNVFSQHWL